MTEAPSFLRTGQIRRPPLSSYLHCICDAGCVVAAGPCQPGTTTQQKEMKKEASAAGHFTMRPVLRANPWRTVSLPSNALIRLAAFFFLHARAWLPRCHTSANTWPAGGGGALSLFVLVAKGLGQQASLRRGREGGTLLWAFTMPAYR